MIAAAVTSENYVEAEVDNTFTSIVNQVGSNKFRHDRTLIPLDKWQCYNFERADTEGLGTAPHHLAIRNSPAMKSRRRST
jgi:hypothetical protein